MSGTEFPEVVGLDDWREALDELRLQEKELTRQLDVLAARRRRLPMVQIDTPYEFDGPDGAISLLDLFDGRRQLIIYHFMFGPGWVEGCSGCSWVADAMPHPAHLAARDTSLVLVSRAPVAELEAYRSRMGWNLPWYSSRRTSFNDDMGATVDGEESHALSVFLRRGDDVFRTYMTVDRGVEHLGSHWTYLDLTVFGRQEQWEDSPPGWPQTEPYGWIRRHDEYGAGT